MLMIVYRVWGAERLHSDHTPGRSSQHKCLGLILIVGEREQRPVYMGQVGKVERLNEAS